MSKTISKFMRIKRYDHDYCQQTVALLMKIPRSTYVRYELDGDMRLSTFIRFLKVTHTDTKELGKIFKACIEEMAMEDVKALANDSDEPKYNSDDFKRYFTNGS